MNEYLTAEQAYTNATRLMAKWDLPTRQKIRLEKVQADALEVMIRALETVTATPTTPEVK